MDAIQSPAGGAPAEGVQDGDEPQGQAHWWEGPRMRLFLGGTGLMMATTGLLIREDAAVDHWLLGLVGGWSISQIFHALRRIVLDARRHPESQVQRNLAEHAEMALALTTTGTLCLVGGSWLALSAFPGGGLLRLIGRGIGWTMASMGSAISLVGALDVLAESIGAGLVGPAAALPAGSSDGQAAQDSAPAHILFQLARPGGRRQSGDSFHRRDALT
jgi:hypothetical protein